MIDPISENLKDLFEVIKAPNGFTDSESFMKTVLNKLSKVFFMHQSMFVYNNENRDVAFVLKNVDRSSVKKYLEYYFRLDPIGILKEISHNPQLVPGAYYQHGIAHLQNIVSPGVYLSSEYYNEFFKPQNVFHEMIGYLKSKEGILGIVGVYRPKSSFGFTEDEVRLMHWIIPYISLALNTILLSNRIESHQSFFSLLEHQSSEGILIFDSAMKLLFKNKRSEEYCNELSSHFPDTFSRYNTIPNILVKDCLALKDEIENFKSLFPTLPKNRLIQYKTKGFSVLTELIEQKNHSITKQLFLIRIKETADRVKTIEKKIQALFHFTARETEIIRLVFEGYKNVEIANTLFISETTVKNHMRHIFQKANVKNRTSLIHILSTFS